MRSLYRFSEFKEMAAPSILIDNEKRILQQYLLKLTKEELLYIGNNFNIFYEEQKKQNIMEEQHLLKDFSQYLANLN